MLWGEFVGTAVYIVSLSMTTVHTVALIAVRSLHEWYCIMSICLSIKSVLNEKSHSCDRHLLQAARKSEMLRSLLHPWML